MAKKTVNKILSFVGGLLGGAGGGGARDGDERITLATVVKSTKKFGESMEDFLDIEYDYIKYLRNRNGGGEGVGGLGGERGSRTQLDRARYRKGIKFGGGRIPRLPRVKTRSRGMPQSKYSKWTQNRAARTFNQNLMKKYGFDRKQIKAFRQARIKGAPFSTAIKIAQKTPKANLLTRTFTGIADAIPNRPAWATRKGWGFFRPGMRERIGQRLSKLNPFKKLRMPRMPGWLKGIKGKVSLGGGKLKGGPLTALALIPDVLKIVGLFRQGKYKDASRHIIKTGVTFTTFSLIFGASGAAGIIQAAGTFGALTPTAIATIVGGTALAYGGSSVAGEVTDNLLKKIGLEDTPGIVNDNNSTKKNKVGSVITSPTRGILGGQKSLVGEAQEPELILPMSKVGDALSAVYREGASVMVGATISFLTPLSGSPAVASVLGEARKLQSIVGTSDIEAETPQVPEIKQVKVKASNTETNNMEQKFNSGGFVTGGTGIDKVPARLTAGEFVMSKGAVKKFGAGTLASMNAAGGGTNRPTPSGGYNQGGKSFDRSHYGTPGYQIGQINPPTLVLSREEYTDHSTERTGKERSWVQKNITERDFEKFTEYDGPILGKTRTKLEYREGDLVGTETYESDIASIGVPDLYEHKDQLLSAIHAVPGYGHVTIKDVINSKVDMPLKQYMMILMTSDAQAATFAKQDAAHQADLELRGIDPSKGYSMGYDMNGGGLVPPAISPSTETSNIKPRPKKNREQLNNTPINITKKAKVKASIVPIPIPKPVVITKQVVVEKPVLKNRTLIISDQGKGVLVS